MIVARSILNNLPEDIAKLDPVAHILHDEASTIRIDFQLTEEMRVGTRRHIRGFAVTVHPVNKKIDTEYSPMWHEITTIKKNNA